MACSEVNGEWQDIWISTPNNMMMMMNIRFIRGRYGLAFAKAGSPSKIENTFLSPCEDSQSESREDGGRREYEVITDVRAPTTVTLSPIGWPVKLV